DNGAGAIAPVMYFPPSFRGNRKVWCYIDSASATTAMEVDIAGGAGAEVIDLIFPYMEFG
ncbi:MAG: hypothetical protein ACYTBZ_24345, partial [Planctomycetota bacterium]